MTRSLLFLFLVVGILMVGPLVAEAQTNPNPAFFGLPNGLAGSVTVEEIRHGAPPGSVILGGTVDPSDFVLVFRVSVSDEGETGLPSFQVQAQSPIKGCGYVPGVGVVPSAQAGLGPFIFDPVMGTGDTSVLLWVNMESLSGGDLLSFFTTLGEFTFLTSTTVLLTAQIPIMGKEGLFVLVILFSAVAAYKLAGLDL